LHEELCCRVIQQAVSTATSECALRHDIASASND
jgi:hypothetical protein